MSFLAALRFLTVIPLPWWRQANAGETGGAASYFPLVGLIIGLVLAGLSWLLAHILPPGVVAVLLLVAMVIISGGMHLDGLIDTCDGIGGRRSPADRLQVMRDSRTGSFGVIGVCLLLLAKYVLLINIPPTLLAPSLMLMPVLGRWAMVYAIFGYPYARPSGLGTVFKQGTGRRRFAVATIICLPLATGLTWWMDIPYFYLVGGGLMLVIWLAVVLAAAYFRHKFSGLTGDTYGAINEIAEVGLLVLVVLLVHNQWAG